MRRFLIICVVLCTALAVQAQDVPYSKYLNFSKQEFKENRFKYDEEYNTWALRKTDKLQATLNVLSVIASAESDVRPSETDYAIVVQMGEEDKAAYVTVKFYSDETYHTLLTFLKDNGKDLVETSSGKLVRYQAFHGDYALELDMKQHTITRTSSHTASRIIDRKAEKSVDESYNEYMFTIKTDVAPWSVYLEKQAAKQAKRDAKGKKKQSVDELM
ncbi:MAG: hypothetical protein IKT82_07230 [Bacteroidaceae bacterium]|nr:hypothetical protein [Bacteroidaceae bacterium]